MTKYQSVQPQGEALLKTLRQYVEAFTEGKPISPEVACQVIYQGRNTLYRVECPEGDFVVKHFGSLRLLRSAYYGWTNTGKARRSYLNALQLEPLSLPTPEPIGYIEQHDALGMLIDSYYICRYTAMTESTLQPYAAGEKYSEPLIKARGEYLANRHECGVVHEDLSPGNIPYILDESTGTYTFYLVDLNRMHFSPYALSRQVSLRNLERLFHSHKACDLLAKSYAEARGWEVASFTKELQVACDQFWLKRLPKLARRYSMRAYGTSTKHYLRLYDRYLWRRRLRRVLPSSSLKQRLFSEEIAFYRRHLQPEDVRRALANREGYPK